MTEQYYKGKYFLAFYEKDDETLKYIFDNVVDICKELGWKITRRNINTINVNLYRALRRANHQINIFRGKCYRVYLIDIDEEN